MPSIPRPPTLPPIETRDVNPARSPNPYRRILRRDYPEPLIALLAFIFGVWIWNHYFGDPLGYAPGTTEASLLKIDRDLRLADAMEADPPWLRWLAGVETPARVRKNALAVCRKLSLHQSPGAPGSDAYAVILAVHQDLPPLETLGRFLGREITSVPPLASDLLSRDEGTWWHARLLAGESTDPTATPAWLTSYENTLQRLRTRAIVTRSSTWLIGLAGLAFLPRTLRCLSRATRTPSTGYQAAWSPALGLTVFFIASLAWIGFITFINFGIIAANGLPAAFSILIDASARLLPALLAVCFLFKKPSHASRVLGAREPVLPAVVLGLFSLLLLIDQFLLVLLGNSAAHAVGGLNPADAGIGGLLSVILSVCLVAPFAEEILFRGILFRSLANRLTVIPAALISSLIFALVHFYNLYGLLSVGILGFACALLYASTRSLTAVIALHALYNVSIKIPQWIVYHAPTGGFLD